MDHDEFCPNCGNPRTGSFRFCRSCSFDYETEPTAVQVMPAAIGTVVASPPQAPEVAPATVASPRPSAGTTWYRTRNGLVGIVVAVIVVLALIGRAVGANTGASASPTPGATSVVAAATATAEPTSTPEPTVELIPTPEPTSVDTSSVIKIGEAVRITCDGADCLDVTVAKVAFASRYIDPSGFLNDTPDKGNVYMAVYVKYKAVGPGADYNEFDWAIYIDDVAGQDTTFVSNGPTPVLNSGQLPVGKSAAGWLIYQVPTSGRVTISYQPGLNGSIFEVTLRAR